MLPSGSWSWPDMGGTVKRLEQLAKSQRHLTPPAFAAYLVDQVRARTGADRVAVLWCDIRGPYMRMPGVECWPLWAQSYRGPYPVIAHPPCGPWGKLKWRCIHQNPDHGPLAIRLVERWGGVVEQPLGSTLYRDHCPPGAVFTTCNQWDFGHPALKPTVLYWSFRDG